MYRNEPPGALSHRNSRFQKPSGHPPFAWARPHSMRPPAFFPRRRIMSNRFSSQGLGPLIRRPPLLDYTQGCQPPPYENFHNPPNYRQKFFPPNPVRNPFPAAHNFSEHSNPNSFVPVSGHDSCESESSKYCDFSSTNNFSKDLPINDDLWIETMAQNGKTYYYHAASRVTQWNKPENGRVMSLQHLRTLAGEQTSNPPQDTNVPYSHLHSQPYLGAIPPLRPLSPVFLYPPATFPIRPPTCVYPPFCEPNLGSGLQPLSNEGEKYYNTDVTAQSFSGETLLPFSEQMISSSTLQTNELESSVFHCDSSISAVESYVEQDKNEKIPHVIATDGKEKVGNVCNVAMETDKVHDVTSEQESIGEQRVNIMEDVTTSSVLQSTDTITSQVDKSRPVSSTPIPASKWCVVWTGDDKVFFYDIESKTSVWEMPTELMHRSVVQKLIEAPPSIAQAQKIKAESEPDIKKIKIEKDSVATNEASSTAVKGNSDEFVAKVSQERENIPHDTRVKLFQEMLIENKVSAFSTWEKELHKIVFDSRYLLLSPKERKLNFELYIREKLEVEKNNIKKEARETKEKFKSLLQEANVTSKTRFVDFSRHYHKDPRYKAVEKLKDKEHLFAEYIKGLCASQPKTSESQSIEQFLELLKEQSCLNADSKWSDIDMKISTDARYKAIGSDTNRRKLFKDHLKGFITKDMDITKQKELRELESIRNRKEMVEKDLSVHMKKLEKERQLHKHESILECYKALLTDLVQNPHSSWREAKKILKEDRRWESIRDLSYEEQEYFFEKHISHLISKKKEQFRQLLNEIPHITLNSRWRDVRKVILEDTRSKSFSKDETKCEREFKEYIRDKVKTAKEDFKQLLKETKVITHDSKSLLRNENYLHNLENVLSNDKRFLILECFKAERKEILLSYIDKLHYEGPPPPPTASYPTKR